MKTNAFVIIFISLLALPETKGHQGLMATLYVQKSAEFYSNSIGIYNSAMDKLPALVEDKNYTAALEQTSGFSGKPPAVILDIDQTVLDNIAYQARLIENGKYYPDGWDAWCMEEKAYYIPGVEQFLAFATSLGVEVFFVTNRTANLEEATRNNLEKLGFSFSTKLDQLLMKDEKPEWTSDKTSRRQLIANDYRIVMMIGDNFGDFVSLDVNRSSTEQRNDVAKTYNEMWGHSWFMLANPTYGDWESAFIDFDYGIPRSKQLEMKLNALDQQR
jgi:5'-nucleotidase (lipoprotein e(P4) family)